MLSTRSGQQHIDKINGYKNKQVGYNIYLKRRRSETAVFSFDTFLNMKFKNASTKPI